MQKRILTIAMALAVILAMALPMGVSAAGGSGNDTTGVSGSIGATYTIDSPGVPASLGSFAAAQAYPSSAMTITASTNSGSTTVTIGVKDEKTDNPGFLTLDGADDPDAVKLTNALEVKGGSAQATYTDLLGGSGVTLASTQSLTSGTYSFDDFSVSQTIESADLSKSSGSYSLIMTFTATFN